MVSAGPKANQGARLSGFTIILIATVASGIASYAVTWLVPRQIGLANYAVFAVFWASIYLVIGALSGIQQEVTRGTQRTAPAAPPEVNRARNFAAGGGALAFTAVVASAFFWVSAVFPEDGWSLVWPLAVGAGSYVVVAVLGGSLYGVAAWPQLALMIFVDSLTRLAATGIALLFTTNVVALAWAVAAPFPLTVVVLWPFIKHAVVGKTQLDVGYGALNWNVARTILAAASTGVMVSGFPLLLGLTSSEVAKATVGLYILTITLSRAPLIVIAMSLQSYFIVTFRDDAKHFWKRFLRLQALVLGGGVVLAAAAWLIGPMVFRFLFPGPLQPDGVLIAALVLSSAFVGALCISSPAVLARSEHFVYSAGWVAAAIVTIVALLLPFDFGARTLLALLAGPLAGLLVHGAYLASAAASYRRARLL